MKEEELLNLIDKINTEKCVVILGPHLATKDEGSIITELNSKLAGIDKVTYYEDEDVLGMAAPVRNNFLQPTINAFFDGYQPNEVYELLSEVPFSLVINTAPDKFLLKAMKKRGITPSYSYYHKGIPVDNYEHNFEIAEESEDKITTQIYNIFGDYNYHGSLVLTFKDMYEYLYSVMQKDNLDEKLRTKIHDAKMVLFFGCSFDKWYFQLFFQLFLQIMDFDDRKGDILNSHDLDPKKSKTKNFIMNEFQMSFFEDNAAKSVKVLYEAVQSGKISRNKKDSFDGPPPKVFISYKWGGESEKIANELKDTLTEKNIVVKIDKEELSYKGDIKEFEKHIGQADSILVVVSHAYLESEHCMFELSEIYRNGNFKERIFPIVLKDAKTFKAADLSKYKEDWVKKRKAILMEIIDDDSKEETYEEDLVVYKQIIKDFDSMTSTFKGSNLGDVDEHRKSKFDVISKQIIKSHRALLRKAE